MMKTCRDCRYFGGEVDRHIGEDLDDNIEWVKKLVVEYKCDYGSGRTFDNIKPCVEFKEKPKKVGGVKTKSG